MGSNLCTADWSESTSEHVLPSKDVDRKSVIISIFSMLDTEETGELNLKSVQDRFDKQSNLGCDFWTKVIGMFSESGVVSQNEFVNLYLKFAESDSDSVFLQQANKFIEVVESVTKLTDSNESQVNIEEEKSQTLAVEDKSAKLEEFDIEIDSKMKKKVPLEQDGISSDDGNDELIVLTCPKDPDDDKEELLIPVEKVDEIKIDVPNRIPNHRIPNPNRFANARNQVERVRAPVPLTSLPPELKVFDFDGDGMLNESELRLAEFSGYEFVEQRLIPLSALPAELKNFDFNHDGYLDENEIRIAEAHGYRFNLNPPEGRLIPLYALPAEMRRFDMNNDGYLDEQEIRAAERQGYVFQETVVEEVVPDDPNVLKKMGFHGDGSLRGPEINAAMKDGFEFVASSSDMAKMEKSLDQRKHKSLKPVEQEEEKFDIVIGF